MDSLNTREIRNRISRHGIPGEIVDMVNAWTSTGANGEQRGNMSIGYLHDGKRKDIASISVPTVADLMAYAEDAKKVTTLVSLAARAIPRDYCPDIPAWIMDDQGARQRLRDRGRAAKLARTAAAGECLPEGNEAKESDAPF